MGLHDQITEYNWCGTRRFRCPVCPADASDRVSIQVHINTMHVAELWAAAGVREPQAELYQSDGALVTSMPIAESEER